MLYSLFLGSLAQLAEQGPLKPKVEGSSPSRPIDLFFDIGESGGIGRRARLRI